MAYRCTGVTPRRLRAAPLERHKYSPIVVTSWPRMWYDASK